MGHVDVRSTVRRNAWFNLRVLGAEVQEYLVDFYGPIDDSINARDESDRLLVAWATTTAPRDTRRLGPTRSVGALAVATPDDIVALRRADPEAAARWRHRLRDELGGALAAVRSRHLHSFRGICHHCVPRPRRPLMAALAGALSLASVTGCTSERLHHGAADHLPLVRSRPASGSRPAGASC